LNPMANTSASSRTVSRSRRACRVRGRFEPAGGRDAHPPPQGLA
jgi:hypothetical protein